MYSRIVLFYGPPGIGKTSLSKAVAQRISQKFCCDYNDILLYEINSQSLYSKYFSESGKMVQKIFTEITQNALNNSNNLYFLLIDEIESLASSRERVISSGEPTDTIRAVNALLTQLDKIITIPNIFVLTTSNLLTHIDSAFADRVDLKIAIFNPSYIQIYSILRAGIYELIHAKIIKNDLYRLQTFLLQSKHLEIQDLLNEHQNSKKLLEISHQLERKSVSARRTKKAILITLSKFTQQSFPINLDQYLLKLQEHQKMTEGD